jgi:hypothetical protein
MGRGRVMTKKIGNRCVAEEAYGGWREVDHEPVLNAVGGKVSLCVDNRPLCFAAESVLHTVRICQRCGCLYLEAGADGHSDGRACIGRDDGN